MKYKKEHIIFGIIILCWIIEFFNLFLGHSLCQYGLLPRKIIGLIGIITSPFLHAGIIHIVFNTIPFIVLGWLVMLYGEALFLEVSLFIMGFGGLGVWIFGRSCIHVGISGIIFGYFGFLTAKAYYDKSIKSIAIAGITLFLYGGLIWGMLPSLYRNISWEGHLFGFIAGIFAAKLSK